MTQSAAHRYIARIDVSDPTVQNVQEFAATWGEVREDLHDVGADIVDGYAVLGDRDFVVVFEAEDDAAAFRADVVLERHGLDVQTTRAVPTEEFAALVADV